MEWKELTPQSIVLGLHYFVNIFQFLGGVESGECSVVLLAEVLQIRVDPFFGPAFAESPVAAGAFGRLPVPTRRTFPRPTFHQRKYLWTTRQQGRQKHEEPHFFQISARKSLCIQRGARREGKGSDYFVIVSFWACCFLFYVSLEPASIIAGEIYRNRTDERNLCRNCWY